MSSHKQRAYSPPRHYVDPSRVPTSYTTSYDTASRGGTSSQSKSSGNVTASGRHSVAYETKPIRKSTFADGKTKTEYSVRPRNNSYAPPSDRRPLTISTRNASPTRRTGSLAVASPREMTPTVVRDDSSRLLLPALAHGRQQSHHQRHNSTTIADLDAREATRERRDKTYHSKNPYVERAYHMNKPPQRNIDDEGWSYTGPREQFHRDYPQRPQARRDSATRKDRPVSYYDLEKPSPRRDQAVVPLSRQVVRSDRADPSRHLSKPEFDSDPDKASGVPKRRHSTRHPVVHQQQQQRDDGYSSSKDDFDGRAAPRPRNDRYDEEPRPKERHRDAPRESDRDRDYERRYHRDSDRDRPRDYERDDRPYEARRKPRSRETSPQRSTLKDLAAGVMGSLATAGVVKGLHRDRKDRDRDDDSSSEDDERRERRNKSHHHRSRKDDEYDDADGVEDRRRHERRRSHVPGESSSDTPDDQPSRRQKTRRQQGEDEAGLQDKSQSENERYERGSSRARTREDSDKDEQDDDERRTREAIPAHKQDQIPESLESRTISPGEDEDDRPRRVQLVEPVREKDEIRPRGILKPARQVPFPEDPNPIREGVAPLKDATKDGIPPSARWTKINRLLVNPEALEKAHERFEEREDYVIVLRVLSREEIQKLADKTKEIRAARERDWQRKLEDRRKGDRDDDDVTASDDGRYDDEYAPKPQLFIEGPQAPPADLHNLQKQSNTQPSSRAMPGGAPVPDINVESSYSQNV